MKKASSVDEASNALFWWNRQSPLQISARSEQEIGHPACFAAIDGTHLYPAVAVVFENDHFRAACQLAYTS